MRSRRPILVTGINRCGSTWIGKTLSHAPYVRYIHEPFNLKMASDYYNRKLPEWFHLVLPTEEKFYIKYLREVLNIPEPSLLNFLKSCSSYSQFRGKLSQLVRYYLPGLLGVRPLVKDPIAFFSADWLAEEFSMDVIVIVRHPAAYFYSLLKESYHHHTLKSIFFNQKDLIEKIPGTVKLDLLRNLDSDISMVSSASILWKVVYATALEYKTKYPNWIFCRYEDVASSPTHSFQELCQLLNLDFDLKIQGFIKSHCFEDQDLYSHVKKVQSSKLVNNWKSKLDSSIVAQIRNITEPISSSFYESESWL